MKSLRQLFVSFTIIMAIALAFFFNLSKKAEFGKRDIVYYNDILHKVEQDIENGIPETEVEDKYSCYIVMAREINDAELSQLYSSGALVMDLDIKNEYVGKVAWNDREENFDDAGNRLLKAGIALWLFVLLGGYVLFCYIYNSFMRPVEELKDFAADIAKGELDKPLPIRKNNVFGTFVEGFDIMREQVKLSIDRERRAEIARKELIQGLSHDIKTPLAVINATCEVLELKYLRKEKELSAAGSNPESEAQIAECRDNLDKVRIISAKSQSVSALMSDVMHASLEKMEQIDINVCEESTLILEERIKNLSCFGNVILENHIYPCLVYMDRQRMEQIIDNIIGNSAKYAGTDILVSFSETEQMLMGDGKSGSFIRITIRDHGPGVDKDDLPLIAEKYYRGRNAQSKSGYGLGMYLCKNYMNKQGGGMEYYNDNGFVVELLLRKV
ncbi:HAMP domain-containing sensor histidine kinase [Butyrivibrio sp. YAB3001]|uniref:HAMP domain-containing sensor histidine kinase n=1 Tax=Butyrivibrio sp. YAB3001 TaxID=1520812 RepID=UPI0008F6220A|nr:HAMP domain-containing sensor histidine kinase [Butyrivibrio sp. YAB3001]SFB75293.1 Histidine kinase-, DNA gyrase B-, and HSP90-like ATPase [Butyrivibrio sp. YAB3001]